MLSLTPSPSNSTDRAAAIKTASALSSSSSNHAQSPSNRTDQFTDRHQSRNAKPRLGLKPGLKPGLKLGLQLGLGLLSAIATSLYANAAQALDMRVAIEENVPMVQIGSSANAIVKNDSGQVLGTLQALSGNQAQVQNGQVQFGIWKAAQIWVEPSTPDGFVWIGNGGSGGYYRGKVLLVPTNKGLTAVNYVDLEQYLYSVVASEMPPTWSPEALKSQAVAARSYILARREKAANPIYDVGDTTTFQVYKGVAAETASTQAAVNATKEQVLSYNNQIIEAVFHSSSGGATENSEDVWSKPLPYLRGVSDYDLDPSVGNPHASWSKSLNSEEIQSKLASRISTVAALGRITNIEASATMPSTRVRRLKITGERGSVEITGEQFRQALDFKSTVFTIAATPGAKSSTPSAFTFQGRGFGHGLGMSQYGAYAMANKQQNYRQILGYYYQGATLSRIRVVN
jgi:stage II sporulation protein D